MGTIPAHHTSRSSPPDAPECVVVVTGSAPLHPRAIAAVPPGAYVVAADGGLDHARAAGLDPDLLVGDLDSISPVGLAWAVEHAQVERHPADKTCTDTELALALAARRSPGHVLLVAGAGDRLDHALAALGALGAPSLEQVAEVEGWWGSDHVRVARPGRPVTLEVAPGTTFSVLAAHGGCDGVTVTGARWPLTDATLGPLVGLGVSNEASAPSVGVAVAVGIATVLVPGAQP
jgi:thiamine pyrophosphokinase